MADDARTDDLQTHANLLRVVVEAVPDGVVHFGLDGSILEANIEARRILGYRHDEVTNRLVADLETTTVHEDGSPCPSYDYPVVHVLSTGKPHGPTTIGVRRADGVTSWAVFRAVPVPDANGKMVGVIVTFVDITEPKRTEAELRRSEAKWRSLAENHPDFVIIVNRAARVESINRTLPEIEMANVIGSSSHAWIHEDHLDDWKRHFAGVLETGKSAHFETRGVGPGGQAVWYETILVPLDPAVNRVLVVARDITARRTMMAEVAEKERLVSVGMLAASVAHEIMNPLTYVLANLDFALSERCPSSERQRLALEDAREGAARMQQIVRDLQSLGRTGSQDLFYVDVRAVLETALRLAGPEVATNVEMIVELAEVPGVLASESRLCQVFINLFVNAAQAMADRPTGERRITVRTHVDEAAGLVGVDVADTGAGIAPQHLTRIFNPFFTTKRAGTGLGLSISRDSLDRMGGRIDVKSEPGSGTTFTVWLSTTRHLPAKELPKT